MPIEIGIVGAGNRGRLCANEYETIDGATVVAFADSNRDAATALAAELNVHEEYMDVSTSPRLGIETDGTMNYREAASDVDWHDPTWRHVDDNVIGK